MITPKWLELLRKQEIISPIHNDSRTKKDFPLGVLFETAFKEVIGGGQAEFDQSWNNLSSDDRSLLYAYINQKGHVEELLRAFQMLFENSTFTEKKPIILDLGCGPYTAGLALLATLSKSTHYTYVGLDRSNSMQKLGEKLAKAASILSGNLNVKRIWCENLNDVTIPGAKSWKPIIVIASYLLASPSLDPIELLDQLDAFIKKTSNGPVTLLYTNSAHPEANQKFNTFKKELLKIGFELVIHENTEIKVQKNGSESSRRFVYALFQRQKITILTE